MPEPRSFPDHCESIRRCKASGRGDGCAREDGHDGEHWWYREVRTREQATGDEGAPRSALWLVEGDNKTAMAHVDFKSGPPLSDEELVATAALIEIGRNR